MIIFFFFKEIHKLRDELLAVVKVTKINVMKKGGGGGGSKKKKAT